MPAAEIKKRERTWCVIMTRFGGSQPVTMTQMHGFQWSRKRLTGTGASTGACATTTRSGSELRSSASVSADLTVTTMRTFSLYSTTTRCMSGRHSTHSPAGHRAELWVASHGNACCVGVVYATQLAPFECTTAHQMSRRIWGGGGGGGTQAACVALQRWTLLSHCGRSAATQGTCELWHD